MVGAAGRNIGKTEFVCRIIERVSAQVPVIALKVTTVQKRDGCCPRGGTGCGVCSSLAGDFEITDETLQETCSMSSKKDTVRMKTAGAEQVYWLRVMRDHLQDGFDALLPRIPQGAAIVCESNSLRTVVEPGLFVVIADAARSEVKESCRQVLAHADRMVTFDGTSFSLPPECVSFVHGAWCVPEDAAAIILAGGKSSRMGEDKSLLSVDGESMIARIVRQTQRICAKTFVSARHPDQYRFEGVTLVPDTAPGEGPLAGIIASLAATDHEINFVCTCDLPDIDEALVRRMIETARTCDAVMPRSKSGQVEPLFAVYRRSILPRLREAFDAGERRIRVICEKLEVRYLEIDDGVVEDLNTQDEYRNYLKKREDL
jgi:molybdopterin-guanine dinucleotide biosynthesis protein A